MVQFSVTFNSLAPSGALPGNSSRSIPRYAESGRRQQI